MVNRRGFTLIEMIVAISVISLTLPVLFTIIFIILRAQTKIIRLSEVKRQGDYALNIIGNLIRNNAQEVYSDQAQTDIKCSTTGSSWSYPTDGNLYFKDKSGVWFRTYLDSLVNQIASQSAVINPPSFNPVYLTNNKVRIEALSISCSRSAAYSTPLINIAFDICYNNNTACAISLTRPEENALLHYQTSIKLRSY